MRPMARPGLSPPGCCRPTFDDGIGGCENSLCNPATGYETPLLQMPLMQFAQMISRVHAPQHLYPPLLPGYWQVVAHLPQLGRAATHLQPQVLTKSCGACVGCGGSCGEFAAPISSCRSPPPSDGPPARRAAPTPAGGRTRNSPRARTRAGTCAP